MIKKAQFFFLLMILSSCTTDIFGPNKGTLKGVIKDTNNKLLEGVTITATFLDADNISNTISAVTDSNGSYFLEDVLLTQNKIRIQKEGFKEVNTSINLTQNNNEQTVNQTLIGSPEISQINISDAIISIAANETSVITVTVKDSFNEDATSINYSVKLLLSVSDILNTSVIMSLKTNSLHTFVFESTLNAVDLNANSFSIAIEVADPDMNFNSKEFQQNLTVSN
jgi:hypothetical protein